MEPIGIALGSVAIVAPSLRACLSAYGVYNKSGEYGREYRVAVRKLMA